MIDLKIKLLSDTAHLPEKQHYNDCAFDVYCDFPTSTIYGTCEKGVVEIPPHSTAMIPTGFAAEVPDGYYMALYARSGIASKRSLAPINAVGLIDAGYRDEVMVPLHNHSNVTQYVRHGERIAQMMICPIIETNIVQCDDLRSDNDRQGGFGSSGTL